MAFDYSRLAEITTIANSAGNIYHHASGTAYIRLIIIHNGNTTSEVVKLYMVPNNGGADGTAGATNIFFNQNVIPNETLFIEIKEPGLMFLDAHDTLQAVTTTASKVTIQVYGGTE